MRLIRPDNHVSIDLLDNDEDLSYLELKNIPQNVYNPLLDYPIDKPPSDPIEDIVHLLSSRDYLHWACKVILNIELLPFQLVILDTLWRKRLPMLIASRGASKSFLLSVYSLLRMIFHPGCRIVIVGAAFRQSRQLHDYMTAIWEKAPVLRDIAGKGAGPKREVDRCEFWIEESVTYCIPLGTGEKIRGLRANYILADEFSCLSHETLIESNNGIHRIGDCAKKQDIQLYTGDKNFPIERPINFIRTPLTDVYKITTQNGFTFKCSEKHQVMTLNGWKLGKDLTTNDWLCHENNYIFPDKYITYNDITVDENIAWLMGILVSEGSINNKYSIAVQMTDPNCIDRVAQSIQDIDRSIKTNISSREKYIDARGWNCKKRYTIRISNKEFRDKLETLGLDRVIVYDKKFPWSILQSNKNVIISFLKGLFEGDGSCFKWKDSGKIHLGIAYYSVSEQLCSEVQFILHKLNISSYKTYRKSKLSDKKQWMVRTNGTEAKKLFDLLNIPKWLGIDEGCFFYNLENQGVVFDRSRNKWKASIYIYGKDNFLGRFDTKNEAIQCIEDNKHKFKKALKVIRVEKLDKQEHLYDFYLSETHSFYGNSFRQHNSIPEDIFNLVVQGFGVVAASPVDKVKQASLISKLKEIGSWTEEMEKLRLLNATGNQIIYSGTAFYSFNHFYRYFKKWHMIISSKGDMNKLKDLFGENEGSSEGFDWKDYAILRIPYNQLPDGFLDPGILAQARATLHHSQYLMEYGAIFPSDSEGFFKRSIIEAATTNKPILVSSGKSIQFSAIRQGNKDRAYVISIDPAADADNAAIVVLEVHNDHRRVVSCWTTNRKKYNAFKKSMKQSGIDVQDDYYRYITKKIRSLMRSFNTERIVMDKNGGGVAIQEALASRDTCEGNEKPVFLLIDPEEPKATDVEEGVHILELVVPTSELNSEANHGMLKDLQDKTLLFPMFDTIEMEKSIQVDKLNNIQFDTYEDLVQEIEELKSEMTTIVLTGSSTLGKEVFDTPQIKMEGGKKGRLRKDRYSALLYANYYARNRNKNDVLKIEYKAVGGTRDTFKATIKPNSTGSLYHGPGALKFLNSNWQKNTTNFRISNRKNR